MMVDVLPTEVEDFHLSSPFLSSDSETEDDSNGSYRYNLDSDTDMSPECLVGLIVKNNIFLRYQFIFCILLLDVNHKKVNVQGLLKLYKHRHKLP